MEDLINCCKYLHGFACIPVYLYHGEELIKCFPQEAENYPPPVGCLEKIRMSKVSCVFSRHDIFFGGVQAEGGYMVVIGHMSPVPLNKAIMEEIREEYGVDPSKAESFFSFCDNTRSMDMGTFFNLLAFVNYVINHEDLNPLNILRFDVAEVDNIIKKHYTSEVFHLKEEESMQGSMAFENEFFGCIENGDLEKLEKLSISTTVGRIANDNLRQQKNMFVVCVTLVCRAAMRGGFAESLAYALSDTYLQLMEKLDDIQEVINLTTHMIQDFCSRVAEAKNTPVLDSLVKRVIEYVHMNTNRDLKVEEIAKHFGVDRSQLSHKFSYELGISLGKFIRQCKLDESKNLLQYTDKSISEISCYLGFANQSHFQRVFKSEMGVTPKEFRTKKK
ncbi:MAG: AraC family transcriptional regulator [Clostridiales bacterium]|jgi:AraC-like DNA-binding protein|nr:AraC family transcriptional regulator [Clostridiales bacterium]